MPGLKRNSDGSPHVHTYVRRSKDTYKCDHPDCQHWMTKTDLKGKRSLCAVCRKNTLILDHEALRRAQPRCADCSDTEEARNGRATGSSICGQKENELKPQAGATTDAAARQERKNRLAAERLNPRLRLRRKVIEGLISCGWTAEEAEQKVKQHEGVSDAP
jgi:hypothetical protein